MVLFDKAYQCWDEFSRFEKRELITEKDLVDWADRINLSKNRSKDYFRAFVQILILAEELIPLEIGIDKLKSKLDIMKFHKGPSPALDKESIEILIFHPIQFIDVIFWSNHLFDYIPLLDKVRSLHDYILLKII